MKICGIICEFNPLHNGHEFLINQAKQMGYEVLCLMSGNFTERGEPAILDKYTRSRLAINAGASAVIELPFVYAVNSADQFAYGAIKILNKLNVDAIMFGSESADCQILETIADLKQKESKQFKQKLKEILKSGESYNIAYQSAIRDIISQKTNKNIVFSSNDILGSSYIAEIKKQKAKIKYHVVKRLDNGYNSTTPTNNFLSASEIIRKFNAQEKYIDFVPEYTQKALEKDSINFDKNLLTRIIAHNILSRKLKLKKIFGISEGLNNLLHKTIINTQDYEELIKNLSSKRYRPSRIKKLLLYSALNLSNNEFKRSYKNPTAVNVLAVDKSKKNILSKLSKSKLKLIITHKDLKNLKHKTSINIDIDASRLYAICSKKSLTETTLTTTKFI